MLIKDNWRRVSTLRCGLLLICLWGKFKVIKFLLLKCFSFPLPPSQLISISISVISLRTDSCTLEWFPLIPWCWIIESRQCADSPWCLNYSATQQSKKVNSTKAKPIKTFLNLPFNKLSEGLPAFDTLLSVHIQIPKPNWISVRTQPGTFTALLMELSISSSNGISSSRHQVLWVQMKRKFKLK